MRRWLVAVVVVSVAVGAVGGRTQADEILTRVVECTATRAHVMAANPNRIGGLLSNVGTINVTVGRGTAMLTLHVGSALEVTPGYVGGLDCQTAGGTTAVEVLEETR